MSDQTTYIPFGGIGEIEFVVRRKDWYKCDATEFNVDKTIPFIRLLIDLVCASTKYFKIRQDWEDTKTTLDW